MNPPGKGLLGSSLHLFTANWLAFGCRFLISILVVRALGTAARGEYALVMALGMIGGVLLQFGLPANTAFLCGRRGYSKFEVMHFSFLLSAGLGGIIASFWLLLPLLVQQAALTALGIASWMGSYVLVLAVLGPPTNVMTAAAAAEARPWVVTFLNSVPAVLSLFLIGGLWGTGKLSVTTVLQSTVGSQVVCQLGCYLWERNQAASGGDRLWPRQNRLRILVRRTLQGTLNNWLNIAFKRLDIVLINALLGVQAAGSYAVAQHFQDAFLSIPRSILGLVTGRLARLSNEEARHVYWRLMFQGGGLMLAAGIVAIPLSWWFANFAFSGAGEDIGRLAALLALAGSVTGVSFLMQALCLAQGNQRWLTISSVVSIALYFAAALLLATTLHLYAFGIAYIISGLAACLMLGWRCARK